MARQDGPQKIGGFRLDSQPEGYKFKMPKTDSEIVVPLSNDATEAEKEAYKRQKEEAKIENRRIAEEQIQKFNDMGIKVYYKLDENGCYSHFSFDNYDYGFANINPKDLSINALTNTVKFKYQFDSDDKPSSASLTFNKGVPVRIEQQDADGHKMIRKNAIKKDIDTYTDENGKKVTKTTLYPSAIKQTDINPDGSKDVYDFNVAKNLKVYPYGQNRFNVQRRTHIAPNGEKSYTIWMTESDHHAGYPSKDLYSNFAFYSKEKNESYVHWDGFDGRDGNLNSNGKRLLQYCDNLCK